MRPVVPAPPLGAVSLHVGQPATSRESSSALRPLALSPAFQAEPRLPDRAPPLASSWLRPCPEGLAACFQAWLGYC